MPAHRTPANAATDAGEDFSTLEFIAEARRPILIARHRALIAEMDAGMSDQFIDGTTEHKRFKAMLEELAQPEMRSKTERLVRAMAVDDHFRDQTVGQALIDHLCLLREQGQEVAAVQMLCIGAYRHIRTLVEAHQGVAPTLAEIRSVPTGSLAGLLAPRPRTFGHYEFPRWYTQPFIESTTAVIRALRQPDGSDKHWEDANIPQTITRDDEAQVAQLPEAERAAALDFLVRDRIRSRFYREVFLGYLSAEELDPKEAEAHRNILGWLQAMAATPHLYPFLQGQTERQKVWRISQLTGKILQLFGIYAWVAHARDNPRHSKDLAGKPTRECLSELKRLNYPALPGSPELTLAAMLCPFATFADFVQGRTAERDFVLPPDSRR